MSFEMPKVTVITITYNLIKAGRRETFLQCVESVKNQTYKNIEHIIIDGASTDGTLELINSTGLVCYSEPDSGIYDAMNKGISKATGKYIVYLNSDDYWHGVKGIELSVESLEREQADFSYGTAIYLKENDEIIGVVPPTIGSFFVRMPFLQQTALITKEKMLELGLFDLKFKSAADYDYMIRLLLSGAKGVEIKNIFTSYRWTGFSKENEEMAIEEMRVIYTQHFVQPFNLSPKTPDEILLYKVQTQLVKKLLGQLPDYTVKYIDNILKSARFDGNYYNVMKANTINKIRILYDARVQEHCYAKDAHRSGVYFVDYNVLKEFSKYSFFEVDVLLSPSGTLIFQEFLNENKDDYSNITIYSGEEKEFDIYFSPFYEIPLEIRLSGISCYTISYDLIPLLLPEKHTHGNDDSPFNKLVKSWTFDDYFFTISNHTKLDLIRHLPKLDPDKITTTLLAASDNFYQDLDKEKHALLRAKYNIPLESRYMFSLCTLEPRKNLIFSIKNFVKFIEKNSVKNLVFVLGGGHWDMFIAELEKTIDNLEKYKSKIIRAGYIDDEDLASLYSHAECTVYASIYEGFGLPPLEAMQCGCPVITSNTSSLPEVVGDAGIMIDPTDDNAMIQAYETIYSNEELRKELSSKGLERAKLFSWEKCAKTMVDTFLKNPYTPTVISIPSLKQATKSCAHTVSSVSSLHSPIYPSYKKKFYIFSIPVLRIAQNNNIKRINLFGIPFLKTTKSEKYKRVFLFGCIRIVKTKIKSHPSSFKIQQYRLLSHIALGKTKIKYKEKYATNKQFLKPKPLDVLLSKLEKVESKLNQLDIVESKLNQLDMVESKLNQLDIVNSKLNQLDELPRKMNIAFHSEQVEHEKGMLLQGKIFAELNKNNKSLNLQDYEFKVFSQFNEDGIIQRLIDVVSIKNKTFIEFGVESFMEANCRFLLMNNNWDGFVIDGSLENINSLKNSYFYWQHELKAEAEFVTRDNINEILCRSRFDCELGILSVDIDGNDYYILESIDYFSPSIIICEYNSLFGSERTISIPYSDNFCRTDVHHSNLYFGASLAAMDYLCSLKGYSLVGTESHGTNAFFVRNDLMNDKLQKLSVKEAFTMAKYRQDRDRNGALLCTSMKDSYKMIQGMPVYNVVTKQSEVL